MTNPIRKHLRITHTPYEGRLAVLPFIGEWCSVPIGLEEKEWNCDWMGGRASASKVTKACAGRIRYMVLKRQSQRHIPN